MLKYRLSIWKSKKLQIAEWFCGIWISIAKYIYKNRPGNLRYIELLCFRQYCNVRTKILLSAGGGKQILPKDSLISSDDSIILDLDMYCPDGQSVHPDVIYDSERQKYLMAISGFPFKNDAYEKPVLLYSKDGVKWELSDRFAKIPIRVIPTNRLGYHSDPALLKHENKLFFFDRTVLINHDGSAIVSIELFVWNNEWRSKGLICSITAPWYNHEKLLSPSFLDYHKKVHCWYCEQQNGVHKVQHLIFDKKWNRELLETCTISGLEKQEYIWHLDVCQSHDELLMAADIKKGNRHEIWLMKSSDGGSNWEKSILLVCSQKGFTEKSVYRGSIVLKGDLLSLYYSGRNNAEYWQTARKSFSLNEISKVISSDSERKPS